MLWSMWPNCLVFCDCAFQSACPLMEKDKRHMEASWWKRLTKGKVGLVLMDWAMLSKSLIYFSVEGWGCVSSLPFDLRPNYSGGNEGNGDLLQKVPHIHCCTQFPNPASGHCWPKPPPEAPGHSQANLGQSLQGSLHFSTGTQCSQGSLCAFQESVSQSCVSSALISHTSKAMFKILQARLQ